ncbi:VPLPA-CTERM sorting domain-containing protein [Hyphococcus luteus]|uniref:PEP-CTERM protein-sorting domain-containing protein n=1 Tax=Hyphococcus luteus TaxID=2058213 RepID=A0A2S7K7G7_9PROT|nr:choice-of-anchor F family protein [Marinicaulis flavus]PQA88433.1 hypothetical protein CW354_09075 [Marinicaulis flavus]
MSKSVFGRVLLGASFLSILAAGAANAATITGWNTDNVVVGPTAADGETGASVVYDADVTGGVGSASTYGQVVYAAPEANTPGLKVVNGDFNSGGQTTAGCVMASSDATCDSPFQSGKRFKNQITGFGPIDFVFNVDPDADSAAPGSPYQVYHRLVNLTGEAISNFKVSLGFGVGDDFVASGADDGLAFSSSFEFGPNDLNASSQFPFGLFGDASTNPNFTLDGFFASERTGLNMTFGEDMLSSNGLYGPYGDIFGSWMSQDDVPTGAFWEFDPTKDPLLLAWLNEDGKWEQRRGLDQFDVAYTLANPVLFDSFADLQAAFNVTLFSDVIEDLANLNVNYAISLADIVDFSNFTLRVEASPVPVPGALPLLLTGLAGFGFAQRRRKTA